MVWIRYPHEPWASRTNEILCILFVHRVKEDGGGKSSNADRP